MLHKLPRQVFHNNFTHSLKILTVLDNVEKISAPLQLQEVILSAVC